MPFKILCNILQTKVVVNLHWFYQIRAKTPILLWPLILGLAGQTANCLFEGAVHKCAAMWGHFSGLLDKRDFTDKAVLVRLSKNCEHYAAVKKTKSHVFFTLFDSPQRPPHAPAMTWVNEGPQSLWHMPSSPFPAMKWQRHNRAEEERRSCPSRDLQNANYVSVIYITREQWPNIDAHPPTHTHARSVCLGRD